MVKFNLIYNKKATWLQIICIFVRYISDNGTISYKHCLEEYHLEEMSKLLAIMC